MLAPILGACTKPRVNQSRADSAQPNGNDATESTFQNARGYAQGDQDQRKNQPSPHTQHQHPTARTIGNEPVDGIDTS